MSDTKALRYPKDVRIDKIIIVSNDKSAYNVYSVFNEINIYEDIFNNTLSGEIIITDSNNLIANIPITGQEKIVISFYSPLFENQKINQIFDIYKISEINYLSEKKQAYVLSFTSNELLRNQYKKISKSFSGKPSDIVETVLTSEYGLESTKELSKEDSSNDIKFVSPMWSPLKLINWLSNRAVSNETNLPEYLFYESTRGFNFRTISSLINEESLFTYVFRPYGYHNLKAGGYKQNLLEEDNFSIESYKIIHNGDTLKNINNGLYASSLYETDITYKSYNKYEYDYLEDIDNKNLMGNSPLLSESGNLDGINLNEQFDSNVRSSSNHISMYNDTTDNKQVSNWLLRRQGRLQEIQNINMKITIAGNNSLTVGDCINVVIPSQEKFDQNTFIEDRLYSGKYMITSIRHQLQRDNYSCVLELTKDSYCDTIYNKNRE